MSTSSPTANPTGISGALDGSAGKGQTNQGISLTAFLASLIAAALVFGIEFILFLLLKGKLARIYQPRTYLVPERERTKTPPDGLVRWIAPVFRTSNSDFIQKCGLDAYFFLRYLRTLLKIFIPLAIVILPVLLPLNLVHGRGPHFAVGNHSNSTNVTGLDTLAWGNVRPDQTSRYWGHLVLAVFVVVYVCFVFFDELRGYIRLRQAYLTSPQHRLRASATTVLVTSIPRKWLSVEALDGLFDVFPGGIRNIWINRNYDELSEKVQLRNKLAKTLEAAETDLIKRCKKIWIEKLKKEEKKAGKKMTKKDKEQREKLAEEEGQRMAATGGISSGDPHQTRHTIEDALEEDETGTIPEHKDQHKMLPSMPVVGEGIEAVSRGLDKVGQTIFGGLKKAGKDVDGRLNTTGGFVADEGDLPGAVNERIGRVYGASSSPDDYPIDERDIHPALRQASTNSSARPSESRRRETPGNQSGMADVPLWDGPSDRRGNSTSHAGLSQPDPLAEFADGKGQSGWKFWAKDKNSGGLSPKPFSSVREDDERPLSDQSPITPSANPQATVNGGSKRLMKKDAKKLKESTKKRDSEEKEEYPSAYEGDLKDDEDGDDEPMWKRYMEKSDRDTMRLPIFGWTWMISLPLIGKKVDTIYYCRKEVARLNLEIERDQQEPEKYPLMNSAFVQFNHQVAAHMACQSVAHHMPKQMAPRIVEISPDDVIWTNMSVKWWERYLRTGLVYVVVAGLIIGWAFPVTFTGLLSQLSYLASIVPWLDWLNRLPKWFLGVIQGILPPALLAALMALLPIILRLLARQQGIQTGMGVEISVQNYYFFFLFVQVFLVVSISSGITTVIKQLANNIGSVPSLLAQNLPKAGNYFFSYMLLQAFSVSAGALVQISGLFSWFILAPVFDSTARDKWTRQTNLPDMQWGTFFPVYTNLAAIGLIYSVVSPLIMIFNIITFSLFWVVYRYNTLYVTKFRFDTGGLLFPQAINQLFTGLYVMELCLVGLFFLVRDTNNGVACKVQAIIMIVVLCLTVIFQYLLNDAFGPLFRYLPITLEDEAVRRDEEFERAQRKRLNLAEEEEDGDNIRDVLEERERYEREESRQMEEIELRQIETRAKHHLSPMDLISRNGRIGGWAERSRQRRSKDFLHHSTNSPKPDNEPTNGQLNTHSRIRDHHHDVESQRVNPIGEALFSGLNDEIEDLTPDERDKLVQRAFQHEALRAKRPVVWIPRDDLGVSDDEIYRTQRFSKHVWISNEFTGLDAKGRVVYRRSPPDFSEVDLIEL